MIDDASSVSAEQDPHIRRIAIIGAGITGLAAAHRIVKHAATDSAAPCSVRIYEASDRLGGIIRTERIQDFIVELGPDSFITNKPAGIQLCEELGFASELIPTDERFRRSLVLRNGRPQPVPDGFMLMAPAKPWAIFTTPVLSLSGKLRLLSETFRSSRPSPTNTDDESLAGFVRRRFGKETLDRLVQPLVGGIYTSDPEKLSLRATMPRFLDMEQRYGSVIRATLAEQKQSNSQTASANAAAVSGSGARYGLFAAPKSGLGSLIDRLQQSLQNTGIVDIRANTTIRQVVPNPNSNVRSRWDIVLSDGTTESFDDVIITLATHQAAALLTDTCCQSLAAALSRIEYASSAIMVSAHRLTDFRHPLDAFGLVIPAIENRRILAVSFGSRKFVGRAPEGHVLLRTFVGGAMQPELLEQNDEQIEQIVNEELRDILGMTGTPLFRQLARYNNSMPQYHVGHLQRVQQIESCLQRLPGLQLAGSAYHGVGIPDSIASAWLAADALKAASAPSPGNAI